MSPGNELQAKAFKITSQPGEITVYYELDNYYNRDIFTLKGRNAKGTDFYVSTQNYFPNGNYSGTAFSGFVVAATEDNTTIEVSQNDAWLYFSAYPQTISITLNAGETFAFRAEVTAAGRHINGVHVESDKPVVITIYDDSIRKKSTNTISCDQNISYDLVGDQIVPVSLVGQKYLILKGQIVDATSCDNGERIFITTTRPGTDIYANGTLVTSLADEGTVFNYPISNDYTLIETSQPVYVFHVTGSGGEMGGAILPAIDGCTGSGTLSITRSPNTSDLFILNLLARNDTAISSPYWKQAATP